MKPETRENNGVTLANRQALDHVRVVARQARLDSQARIARVLRTAELEVDASALIDAVRRNTNVTVNFHPDRLLADGRDVAAALREDGVYRSQFETGISNGGLTAHPGGDRDRWEQRLFGGAYQISGGRNDDRPKYGGLNIMNYTNGACPRFGSCHLRLTSDAIEHSTFSYGDSAADPSDVAVIDAFEPVLASLLDEVADSGRVLGLKAVEVTPFLEWLLHRTGDLGRLHSDPVLTRSLDHYIETQIHFVLDLSTQVDAVVIDRSFEGTAPGDLLLEAATDHGFDVEWLPSLTLAAADVPEDVPGPDSVPMHRWRAFCGGGRAARLAGRVIADHSGDRARLDAASIGAAAVSAARTPETWREWDSSGGAMQCLKDLWLMLVVLGRAST